MKKLLAVMGVLATFIIGGRALAEPTAKTVELPSSDLVLTETINNIPVPYQVLFDIQMQHQGYAVMSVQEAWRSGQKLFQLQIASADGWSREKIFLLYNGDWEFIREEKAFVPAPKEKSHPRPDPSTHRPTATESVSQPEPEEDIEEPDEGPVSEEEEDDEIPDSSHSPMPRNQR